MQMNLVVEADQKRIFQDIRNFLAGRMVGATRDQSLLEEVMKCLFIRKQLILSGRDRETDSLDDIDLAKLYRREFKAVPGVFASGDQILLDPMSLRFVNDKLAKIDLLASDRDPVGDLYETFVGSAIRGQEGQFFTPQNAGRWLVEAIDPTSGEYVIDPACGAGGFLVWASQRSTGLKLFGIEKDEYLATLARARTAIVGADADVRCGNSLSYESDGANLRPKDYIGAFDVVLANPPFGKNIKSVSLEAQMEFELGYKWKLQQSGIYNRTNETATKAPPQILFIERIISMLKKGGRAGIVVPESMLGSRSYGHVVQYLRHHSAIKAVVGMPEALFKSSGKGGTHTKTCLLVFEKGKPQSTFFLAEARWCGHDSRGRSIPKDDLPVILKSFRASEEKGSLDFGYRLSADSIAGNILSPRYHEPATALYEAALKETHDFVPVGDLVESGVLEIKTGNEVGKLSYGTGEVPFVRTSDISGWEVKIDPKHCISEEIYSQLRGSQDVRQGDILMVRDGTYLIGSCAIVTSYDEKIVYQSHIYKIRCLDHAKMSPYLLLALLSCDPVQKQIKSKTFTQDIIDSLGSRVLELVLPIPKSEGARAKIIKLVETVIADRVEARELARQAKLMIVDPKYHS